MLFNSVPEKKNMNLIQNDALIRLHIYLKRNNKNLVQNDDTLTLHLY